MIATASPPLPKTRSPALRGFELNPFRVLRLPVQASTSEAGFQAESILTLARLGLHPDEEDLLPWLPPAGPYELQQAAQVVEEPLMRLREQLLWFDFARDPHAALLKDALRAPRSAAAPYLAAEVEPDGAGPDDPAAVVARDVNQANLRLLLAAARVSRAAGAAPTAPAGARPPAPGKWQTLHGLRVLPQAHEALAGICAGDAAADTGRAWGEALLRWVRILTHPGFRPYLDACIADLGDDFVSSDDAEAVEESILTHLADLVAQETRFLLLEGRYPPAAALIAEAVASGLDARVLGPAMRPLRHVFQAELSELEPLLDVPPQPGLRHFDAYLNRLEAIQKRWLEIDRPEVIGLRDFLDEAAEQVYLRLRGHDAPDANVEELLAWVEKLASAKSLRERVGAYRKQLETARTRLCHFCKDAQPDYDRSVVLRGKKETRRERHFNSTTIYYAIRYAIVLRCGRCARHHDFIRTVGHWTWASTIPGLALFVIWLVS